MSAKWDAWVKGNIDSFERRLPLSAFLKRLPNWALVEIQTAAELGANPNPEELSGFAVAAHAALIHESLWQDGDCICFSTSMVSGMGAAACLEAQRRMGIIRWEVNGDDRLGSESITIELNPAIMSLVASDELQSLIDVSKPELSPAEIAFNEKVSRLAMASNWCDREALEAP